MTRKKFEILMRVVLMAAVSFIFITAEAIAGEDDVLREIQDRAQINKLMWDYARALDTGNVEAYCATFTKDGQFGRGANAVKGRQALREMMGAFRKSPTVGQENVPRMGSMYHMTANHYIEFIDKDHAVFHGYWLAFMAGSGENTQPTIVGVGREVNEVVRVDGKWLIQVRDIMPQN
jgi:hypothetical protein